MKKVLVVEYSLARMTMSIPQNMLMIQPTMTMAVTIWMKAAAMFSQKTQHMCLSGRSVLAPHRTVKAETNVPVTLIQWNSVNMGWYDPLLWLKWLKNAIWPQSWSQLKTACCNDIIHHGVNYIVHYSNIRDIIMA